jgi:hypothetical protein
VSTASSICCRHLLGLVHAAGFKTYKRDGLVLAAEFNATVNADMAVGGLEETITVTGESPIVDVQSAKRQRTLDSELVQALPTAKGYAGVMVLIPSMVQSGGGVPNVQLSPGMVVFGGRGGRGNEGRAQVDGLNTGASLNGGGVSGYRQDVENAAEIAITTAGGLGETEVGGPTINIVPRTGGNTFRSHAFFSGLRGGMQSSNYTDELKAAGSAHAGQDELHLRHQLLARRPDQEGPDLVLLPRLLPRQREQHPGHVLQQERVAAGQVGYVPDEPVPRSRAAAVRCSRRCASPSSSRSATS